MIGNKRPAFTLIELLVVTAVFSLAVLLASTVFVNAQNRQRQVLNRQRVVADGRYILEDIARSVRTRSIDYTYYQTAGINLSQPVQTIALRDQNNVQTCYIYNGTANPKRIDVSTGTTNCGGTLTAITPNDLTVLRFETTITPHSNPYAPPPSAAADCNAPVGASQGYQSATGVCACTSQSQCFGDQLCTSGICRLENKQPTATVWITTENASGTSADKARSTMQTTISSRTYRR